MAFLIEFRPRQIFVEKISLHLDSPVARVIEASLNASCNHDSFNAFPISIFAMNKRALSGFVDGGGCKIIRVGSTLLTLRYC